MFKLMTDEDSKMELMTDKQIDSTEKYIDITHCKAITAKCPLCSHKGLNFENEYVSMEIFKDRITVFGEGCIAVRINFCPFCGRALYE